MKFGGFKSIAVEITLLVLVGTVIVFQVILAYSYVYSKQIILGESERSARNLTASIAGRMEPAFRGVEKIPRSIVSFIEAGTVQEDLLLPVLRHMVDQNPEIFGAAVAFEPYEFDANIKAYAPYFFRQRQGLEFVQLSTTEYNYFQQDWYHIPKELQRPCWSEPYFDEGGGRILMSTYSVPFFQRDGEGKPVRVKGIVTADISLERLTTLVAAVKVLKTGFCFVISGNGTFVSHPRQDLIMRESIFSVAEERNLPALRTLGRTMIREESGFVDVGTDLTGTDSFLAFARIPSTGWSLAAVFPRDELFEEVTGLFHMTQILAVTGILLLLAVSLLVARSISRPLRSMAAAATKVGAGDLNVAIPAVERSDEVGLLARALRDMVEGLKQRDFIRDTFGRYLTREVVNRLLESKDGLKLGGESREISIMMSDIRGFTAVTADMHPEQVITFLNRYLGKMVEILLDHRGVIDEIIGDGILAFFGAPEPLEDHPARATACALRMQEAMDEINALNEADGLPRVEMGVAVNTGRVVVGNIGSERRTKYGAVGSQVNFTGRMESFTVGGQVLISEATYRRISDVAEVGNILNVEMKGIQGTVHLYDVRGIRGEYDVHLPLKEEERAKLSEYINVAIRRLDQKTMMGTDVFGSITEVAASSAVITVDAEMTQWENLRLRLLDENREPVAGEVYAKVTSVEVSGGVRRVEVRFTSISADAYRTFRNLND